MRKYLPTTAQLIDRLAIVTLKSIKNKDSKETSEKEAHEIMHDLDNVLAEKTGLRFQWGQFIRATQVNKFANEVMWENESFVRKGEKTMKPKDVAKYLTFTHSMNRVRNQAMNVISSVLGEREDLKTDYLDASLTKRMGYDLGSVI